MDYTKSVANDVFPVIPLWRNALSVSTKKFQRNMITNPRTKLVTACLLLLLIRCLFNIENQEHLALLTQYLPLTSMEILCSAIWVFVFLSSTSSTCIILNLLRKTWRRRWELGTVHPWLSLLLSALGTLSCISFVLIVIKADESNNVAKIRPQLKWFFYIAALARLLHSIVSDCFTVVIAPVTEDWTVWLDKGQIVSLKKLVIWRLFLFFHWNILIPTFGFHSYDFFSILHCISFLFRVFVIIWLVLSVIHILNMQHVKKNKSTSGEKYEVSIEEESRNNGPYELVLPHLSTVLGIYTIAVTYSYLHIRAYMEQK